MKTPSTIDLKRNAITQIAGDIGMSETQSSLAVSVVMMFAVDEIRELAGSGRSFEAAINEFVGRFPAESQGPEVDTRLSAGQNPASDWPKFWTSMLPAIARDADRFWDVLRSYMAGEHWMNERSLSDSFQADIAESWLSANAPTYAFEPSRVSCTLGYV